MDLISELFFYFSLHFLSNGINILRADLLLPFHPNRYLQVRKNLPKPLSGALLQDIHQYKEKTLFVRHLPKFHTDLFLQIFWLFILQTKRGKIYYLILIPNL